MRDFVSNALLHLVTIRGVRAGRDVHEKGHTSADYHG
jgi:hypothetical protein